jgi:hypothetical protein
MNHRTLLIVALHGSLLMGGAYAADRIAETQRPLAAPTEFATLDADGDGRLSRDEARADASLERVFRGVDTDGDLQVSRDEHATWVRAQRAGARPQER